MSRWLIVLVVAVAVGIAMVVIEVIDFGGHDDRNPPQRVIDAARRGLSCPGEPASRVRCEPIPDDRWRCRAVTGGFSGQLDPSLEIEVVVDEDHPKVSVAC